MPPLGYSSNLHPAETLEQIIAEVVPFAAQVRGRLGWSRLGVDLRLGNAALAPLADDVEAFAGLRQALDGAGLSAHTLNGFPLRPFQSGRVKEQAYLPDWSEHERAMRSVDLLTAALALSDERVVTISTVPGSYRPFGAACNDVRAIAAHLGGWAAAAHMVQRQLGRTAILCLEPEPWCFLENSHDVAWFWQVGLIDHAIPAAAQVLGGDAGAARAAVRDHLGICFDTCHVSLAFEDQRQAVERMVGAGVRVAKCQVSAAPEVRDPHRDPAGVAALRALAEPRFLHQTAAATPSGSLSRVDDLDQLDRCLGRLPQANAVRSHFHIPLFREPTPRGLSTTVADSVVGLRACLAAGCAHIAVETYTWSILAGEARDILDGTVRELAWLDDQVRSAGRAAARPPGSPADLPAAG